MECSLASSQGRRPAERVWRTGFPFTVVKDVLLYLQADYRKTCSFSLLFPSSLPKNMEMETEPRSYEVTPDLSLDASMYVDVCGCVSM